MGQQDTEFGRLTTSIDEGLVRLGDVMRAGFMRSSERHPVVRTGERAPIPGHVRAAIWYRDHGRCVMCPGLEWQPEEPMHLDHIVPWSAGGPDTSDNLRLLCEAHNVDRSNYIDFAGPRRAVTWWCHRCYDRDGPTWGYFEPGIVECPIHLGRSSKSGKICRVERAYDRVRASGSEASWWHMREGLVQFRNAAYCAHCDAPGLTNVTL